MKKAVHWADRMAEQWLRRRGKEHTIEIGVSPSGPIHLGFLRETMLGDVFSRVLREAGAEVRFMLFVDSMDPLRKRYPFLDEAYEAHIGKPLCEIPAPWGDYRDYAETFLAPFERSLEQLGVDLEIVRSEEPYRAGCFTEKIALALEHKERIAEIIEEESGRQLEEDWAPVNPICSGCGRLSTTRVLEHDREASAVRYRCECGREAMADYSKGEVKLPWRIDWPARWSALHVTVEPFGKDHASPGGSYATGRRICREVFGDAPPEPVPYEWINLKGAGAMSSSKGIAVAIETMLEVVPAEVLRYLILRARPNQAIDFDPSNKLIQIVDEFEGLERRVLRPETRPEPVSEAGRRNYFLARIDPGQEREPVEIPFRLLTTLVQVAAGDDETLKAVLARTGYGDDLARWPRIQRLAECARRWVEEFAPEEHRMQLSDQLPEAARSLSPGQVQLLENLADYLQEDHPAEEIHQQIYTLAEGAGLPGPQAFQAIYIALIGKERGPRAGFFLASLERDFLQRRFRAVRSSVL